MPRVSPHLPGCRALRGLPPWFLSMRTRDPSSPSHAALRGDTREEDCVQGGLCAGPALPLVQQPVEGLRPQFGRNRWSHIGLGAWETGCGSVGGHQASSLQRLSEGSPASKARTPLPPPLEAPEAPLFPDHHRPASGNPAPWRPQGLRWAVGVGFAFSPGEMAGGDGNKGSGEASPRGGGDQGWLPLSPVFSGGVPEWGRRGSQSDAESRGRPEPLGTTHSIFGEKKLQAPSPEPSPPCLEAPPTLTAALKAPTPWSPPT